MQKPTEEYYEKLGKVITYVCDSIHLPLTLGSDGSGTMVWNSYALYAVYPDYKSNTGATCTLGHGIFIPILAKQKFMTKSGTETALVAVDDAMTFVMRTKQFFE